MNYSSRTCRFASLFLRYQKVGHRPVFSNTVHHAGIRSMAKRAGLTQRPGYVKSIAARGDDVSTACIGRRLNRAACIVPVIIIFWACTSRIVSGIDDPSRGERIADLIEQLGYPHPAVREAAEASLLMIGAEAVDELRAAEHSSDPEIAGRARYLLRSIELPWIEPDDPEDVKTLMGAYLERGFSTELFSRLVRLPEDAGIEPLCRIVRFESSAMRAKWAALEIILAPSPEPGLGEHRKKTIRAALARSDGVAVDWIETHVSDEREASAQRFSELAASERKTAELQPDQGQPYFAGVLHLLAAEVWLELGNDEKMAEALEAAAEVCRHETFMLFQLASQFAARFPFPICEFVYRTALEETRAPSPANGGQDKNQLIYLELSSRFSELLHDQGKNQEAAEMRKVIADFLSENPNAGTASPHRSRQLYFEARSKLEADEPKAARDLLEQAIRADRTDGDVLIAMYELSADDSQWRSTVLGRIQSACLHYKRQIEEKSSEQEAARNANFYGWLVSNTEGDFDEAVRLSEKSLEISPNTAAYLDTLAHCYFAKGDYAAAVKHQSRAARLEPHSKMIQDKLAKFQQALNDSQSQESGTATSPPEA